MKLLCILAVLCLFAVASAKPTEPGDVHEMDCGCHHVSSQSYVDGDKKCITITFTSLSGPTCHDVSNFALEVPVCHTTSTPTPPPTTTTDEVRRAPVAGRRTPLSKMFRDLASPGSITVYGDCNGGTDTGDPPCNLGKDWFKTDAADTCLSKQAPTTYILCSTTLDFGGETDLVIKSGLNCDLCHIGDGFCVPPSGGGGDPHFVGFRGQNFDFDGQPKKFYNFFSSANLEVNAYLEEEKFHNHVGTFIRTVGIQGAGYKVEISSRNGGGAVLVNGKPLALNSRIKLAEDVYVEKTVSVNRTVGFAKMGSQKREMSHPVDYKVNLETREFSFEIYSSIAMIDFNAILLFDNSEPVHGVVGQTMWNVRVPYQFVGKVEDYEVSDLWATNFKYNLYTQQLN